MISYLRLLRLPNVFTAVADVAMGYALARHQAQPIGLLLCLVASSGFLYLAGMVLNDVWDVEIDRRERPQRPIPSGAVALSTATLLGWSLLLAGILFGWLASAAFATHLALWWKCGCVATLLAGAIVSYDRWVKHTLAGPVNMGLCRFLNVLLGASAGGVIIAPNAEGTSHLWLGYDGSMLMAAAGLGIYIMGVTIFALKEAEESPLPTLTAGGLVMLVGLGLFACSPTVGYFAPQRSLQWFWVLLALLSVAVLRRVLAALYKPEGKYVQAAVKESILSLILFDAALCLMYAPLGYSLAVVALIVPAVFLGRWIYST